MEFLFATISLEISLLHILYATLKSVDSKIIALKWKPHNINLVSTYGNHGQICYQQCMTWCYRRFKFSHSCNFSFWTKLKRPEIWHYTYIIQHFTFTKKKNPWKLKSSSYTIVHLLSKIITSLCEIVTISTPCKWLILSGSFHLQSEQNEHAHFEGQSINENKTLQNKKEKVNHIFGFLLLKIYF